tara:strand:+ start:810 stop:1748 length:939 start_codon:yes stop_codon:yes gene_type:complete
MNIIFMGTPDFACPTLNALINSPHRVLCVYTQPDRRRGRGRQYTYSPVKNCAIAAGLTVHQPTHLKDPHVCDIIQQADLLVVAAYGLILPQSILDTPRYGALNIHASLLPRWRGASPIQRAIQAGDALTGITFMKMEAGLDTGPTLTSVTCPIQPHDTSTSLSTRLADLAADHLIEVLDRYTQYTPQPQPTEGVEYAPKLNKAEACIDWSQSALHIERSIRAFQPWPCAYTELQSTRIKIFEAQCHVHHTDALPGTLVKVNASTCWVQTGEGILELKRLQLPNKTICDWKELYLGHASLFKPGNTFHSVECR